MGVPPLIVIFFSETERGLYCAAPQQRNHYGDQHAEELDPTKLTGTGPQQRSTRQQNGTGGVAESVDGLASAIESFVGLRG